MTHFRFTIEEWDEREIRIVETLAGANHNDIAVQAFNAAVTARPRSVVLLRNGTRVVKRQRPDGRTDPPGLELHYLTLAPGQKVGEIEVFDSRSGKQIGYEKVSDTVIAIEAEYAGFATVRARKS